MKRITLDKILHSLETMTTEVLVEPAVSARAKIAIDRMLAVKLPAKA
jgi:quinolinate synthase